MKAWHFGSISNCGTTSSARKFSGNVMPSKASLASNCSNKKITESSEIQTPILGSLLQIQIAEYPLCLLCSSQLGSLDRCQRLQCRCEIATGRIPFRCNPSNRSWQPASEEESSWNLGMTSNWLAQLANPITVKAWNDVLRGNRHATKTTPAPEVQIVQSKSGLWPLCQEIYTKETCHRPMQRQLCQAILVSLEVQKLLCISQPATRTIWCHLVPSTTFTATW